MRDVDDETSRGVLGEALVDELKAIREGIAGLPTRVEFGELKADVAQLQEDMTTVKADHDEQIGRLRGSFPTEVA